MQDRVVEIADAAPALIIEEPFLFTATYHFLASRGVRVPEDVSLLCTDEDPMFSWCEPSVAHISFDQRPVVRRVARWVAGVSRRNPEKRQKQDPAKFVAGGTIGPAR